MPIPIVLLPHPESAERSRLLVVDEMRKRALERLYTRRAAVEDLIQSLESYQRAQGTPAAECREFSTGRKCS